VSYVSDDAAAFGDANGYNEKGAYLNLDGKGSIAAENYRGRWVVEDLGLDSRRIAFSGGNQGRYDYHVDYQQLPRHRYDTTATIFRQSGPDSLALPSDWVRSPVTSGFSALDSSLQGRDISSERRLFAIGGAYLPSEQLRMSVDFRHDEQDGVKITGGSYFTQASLLPAPFDFTTDEAEVELRYATDRGYASVRYFAAFFKNDNLALQWETPFTSAVGAEIGALAQPPDNSFQQISLAGNYHFSALATVLGFSAASGRIEQDQLLLPYTSNSLLSTGALPGERLNGEIQTSNIALTLTSRPFDKARVRLAYRLDDRDNTTPIEQYERVITDTFVSNEVESNVPYSFRKSRLSIDGSYRLWSTVKLSAGYDRANNDRDYQEVAEQTEDTGWAQLGWRPNSNLDIRVKAGAAERDIQRYDETVAVSLGQNPLLRKYNLAYRFRQFTELTVAGSLPEKPVSMTLSALYANDDYTQSKLGLLESDDLRVAGDLNFTLAENRYFYIHGGYETIQADQMGSEQFATADWSARNTDSFVMGGAGLYLKQIGANLDLRIDYTRTQGNTEISINSLASGLSWFPDLESTMNSLRVQLNWQQSAKLALNFGIRYESFVTEDWALQGVQADTVPVVLALGAEPYDYDVLLVGASVTYRMGR
jgi:MtrB/PioB family decaheme-associated outer membrane protein